MVCLLSARGLTLPFFTAGTVIILFAKIKFHKQVQLYPELTTWPKKINLHVFVFVPMFIGGVNLSENSNSAPSPGSTPGYLEPIPFHLAQFSTPVHRGGDLCPRASQKGMIQLQKSSAVTSTALITFILRGGECFYC